MTKADLAAARVASAILFDRAHPTALLAACLIAVSCSTSTPPVASLAPSATVGAGTPSSGSLIEAAEQAGTIDHDTALLYEVYAALDATKLPSEYGSGAASIPEATSALGELAGRLDQLNGDLRQKVEPYLKRPTEPDSAWALREAPAGGLAPAFAAVAEARTSAIEYAFVDVKAPTPVRVWYALPLGDSEKQLAQKLATEIETSDMWAKEKKAMAGREPCSDLSLGNSKNGGSGALDVYLAYPSVGLDWSGRKESLVSTENPGTNRMGVTVREALKADCGAIAFMVLNATLSWDDLRVTMAHELFHTFQYAFKDFFKADRGWWREATATWSEDLVYPSVNSEQSYLDGVWAKALRAEGPLDDRTDTREYAAYLWPFFLRQVQGGDETAIGRIWEQTEGAAGPLQLMHDTPGWADKFKRFALWNWNREPVQDYRDSGAAIPQATLSQNATCLEVSCRVGVGKQDLNIDLAYTSVDYYEGRPQQGVEQLRFKLGDLKDKPGAGLQAIVTIGPADGDHEIRTEDWTGLDQRVFCIARENVTDIVLVATNSAIDPAKRLQGKVEIEALGEHCGGGTATMKWTKSFHFYGTNACPGDSTTTDETFELNISVSFGSDGTGTATLDQTRESKTVDVSAGCGGTGGNSLTTTTVSEHVSGTSDTDVNWSIDDEGSIEFYAGWDFVDGGSRLTVRSCEPIPCDSSVEEEEISEFDVLSFSGTSDPDAQVITGSKTEDNSTAEGSDVIIYTWTIER